MTSSRLAIAASWLAECATERSDGVPCPPVVAYSQEFLGRSWRTRFAACRLDHERMLADYQVMDQARACERFGK